MKNEKIVSTHVHVHVHVHVVAHQLTTAHAKLNNQKQLCTFPVG